MLKNSHVLIIGLGGTGTWVASLLVQAGLGHITVADFDVVERSNLNRQTLYRTEDIGRKKIEASSHRLREINPNLHLHAFDLKLTEETDLGPFLEEVDLVINCSDSPNTFQTGMWVAKACMPRKIPHIIGGGYNNHLGIVGPTILPFRSPCWGCYAQQVPPQRFNEYPILHPRTSSAGTSFIMNASMVASMQAFEAIKVLTRIAQPAMVGRKAEVDMFKFTISYEMFRRHPRCELCGAAGREASHGQARNQTV